MRGGIIRKNDWRILLSRLFSSSNAAILPRMQRLFSMFPSGMAGAGLLILRVASAAVLLVDGPAYPLADKSIWLVLFLAIISGMLCVGLFTPCAAVIGCLIHLFALWEAHAQGILNCIVAAPTIAAVGMLGPGAYSFDARLFGRKLVSFPGNHKRADRR